MISLPNTASLIITSQLRALAGIKVTTSIPTAGVTIEGGKPYLYYNKEFWDKLTDYEKSFIIDHEMLHLILDHHERTLEVNDRLANVACDLAINGFLENYYDRANLPTLNKTGLWCDNFKYSRGHSVEYYLDLLKYNLGYSANVPVSDWGASVRDLRKGQLNKDKATSDGLLAGKEAGKDYGNKLEAEYHCAKGKRKFTDFLVERTHGVDNILTKGYGLKEAWGFQNRAMSLISRGGAMLPAQHWRVDQNTFRKNVCLVFMDVSGSCSKHAQWFTNACASIPKRYFHVEIKYFDVQLYDVPMQGGGTSFAPLTKYYSTHPRRQDINRIFVLSDGQGTQERFEDPHKWHWFLTPCSTEMCIDPASPKWSLNEFIIDSKGEKSYGDDNSYSDW